ncbi:uncharacterized protein LOC112558804 [Pomacea canaliculata]|uniref:uncharacterized protein LOC112558804 n=1 Tax=Pomacea canaliculata TaxID=400727 RepID=UPI000D73BA76|nr:uncharacterized protein LOC112558804 [Pomacea canaliculata]
MSFSVILRDLDEEKERAIRQLFERNGWSYNAERLPHQTSRKRGRYPVNKDTRDGDVLAIEGGETLPPGPGAAPESESLDIHLSSLAECPHCFQAPCITSGAREVEFIGKGQAACPQNRGIRNRIYTRYWKMLDFVGLWKDKRYLVRKTALAEGEWVLCHRREVMPTCVVQKVRTLYPNPDGVPYVGHQWE